LFVIDVDVLLLRATFPDYHWLLDYKFLFFVSAFAVWLLIGNRKTAFVMLMFFAFYPLYILLWRIPKFILGRRSWVLAFAALNFAVSFIRSFRRNVVVSAILLTAIAICTVSQSSIPLILAASAMCLTTLYLYGEALFSIFKSPSVYAIYQRLFPAIRNFVVTSYRLDETIKAIPAEQRSEVQQKEWVNKLDLPLLTNRVYIFLARRFADYQRSLAPCAVSLAQIIFLFLLTTIAFACINMPCTSCRPALTRCHLLRSSRLFGIASTPYFSTR
jgi:hypothetical protein